MLRRVIEENFQKICHTECWVRMELGTPLSMNISLRKNFKNLQNQSSEGNFFFFIEWSNKSFLSKNIVFHQATKIFWIKMLFWMFSPSNSDGLSVWVLIFFFFCKKMWDICGRLFAFSLKSSDFLYSMWKNLQNLLISFPRNVYISSIGELKVSNLFYLTISH